MSFRTPETDTLDEAAHFSSEGMSLRYILLMTGSTFVLRVLEELTAEA